MALSYVTHVGDGSTVNFSVPFGYIESTDVDVYVDGVLKTYATDWNWFNPSTVQFTVAPASAAVVKIVRTTQNTTRLVDFQDAGNLTEYDLDTDSNQLFYLTQEGLDNFNDNAMSLDTDDKWEANSKIIKNVTDPTADQEAATKKYVDDNNASVYATAAAASAAAAATSETNAATSASNASTSASNAATSASDAAASYDAFDDRYLGSKASDPALDNDGDPLATGALYFNTTTNNMRVYNGSSWQNASTVTMLDYAYTASASQTVFSGADDNSNTLTFDSSSNVFGVYQNGVRLIEGAANDYTIGTNSVTLVSGAALNDELVIQVATNFDVSGAISQTTADTRYLKKTDDLSDMYTPTKGNILVADGTSFNELAVGANNKVLIADSTQTAGVRWDTGVWTELGLYTTTTGGGIYLPCEDFEGTVEEIRITFGSVAFTTSEKMILQLGYGATPTWVTTGYLGQCRSGTSGTSDTTGFPLDRDLNGSSIYRFGTITLSHVADNSWVIGGTTYDTNIATKMVGGRVNLGASNPLTAIRLHTISTTGVFNGGGMRISYYRSA